MRAYQGIVALTRWSLNILCGSSHSRLSSSMNERFGVDIVGDAHYCCHEQYERKNGE
jgi:hypothetical protein